MLRASLSEVRSIGSAQYLKFLFGLVFSGGGGSEALSASKTIAELWDGIG